ncbi:MATE family efflux transporter [Cardinium endosymbiont of Tipula unca]|uniref:MATE family efflux transporter n=1 Tax=Cardinium endosymbiont of Tipula unca TaxID=3066216 RepID=UPI0030D4DA4B
MRSYPIIFSTLNFLALEAVNAIMASRIGMYHAASAVFANTLFNIFKRVNSGISVSVSPLVALADRKKNNKKVTQILNHALVLNTFFAFIFFIILIGLSICMEAVSQSLEISALGRPYLLIISVSLIPSAINNMIRRYLEGLSCGKIGLFLGFLTLVINIIFNFLLIYGKCGFPILGLNGAGIAILLSETLTAVVGMLYLAYVQPNGYPVSYNIRQISWKYFKKILGVGLPAGLQLGIEGVYLLFIAIMAGWASIEAQAAHAILFNICQLTTIFTVSLGLSGAMLVAQQRGNKNGCLVRKVALTGCVMIVVISVVVGLALLFVSPYIVSFYKPIYSVNFLVGPLIKHLSLFQLFYGLCYWGNSVLRGLDDRTLPLAFSGITQLIGIIGCYIAVVKYNWGISGVWLSLIFERMLLSLFLFVRFECKTKTYS